MASKTDRRRHRRHPIENTVSVTSVNNFQLIDISEGGFKIICHPYTCVTGSWETDILNPIKQLVGYPATRVWASMPEHSSSDFLPMVVGVQFGKLTREQKNHLLQVINGIVSNNTSA